MDFKLGIIRWLLTLGFVLGVPAFGAEDVERLQKKVYELARQAAIEQNNLGTLKAWLIQQALIEQGYNLEQAAPFHRLIWLSLDRERLCPDLAPEQDDLGLWSVVFYNFAVRGYRETVRNFGDLTPMNSDKILRLVNLESSLSLSEWKSLKVFRAPCRLSLHLSNREKMSERARHLKTLENLLIQAMQTLNPVVSGRELLGARLEQVRLALAREMKTPPPAMPSSNLNALEAKDWANMDLATAAELFSAWKTTHSSREATTLALAVVDSLIAMRDAEKVSYWIAEASSEDPQLRAQIWGEQRGNQLVSMDHFSERALIALYRGVQALEANRLEEGFRSFALAKKFAGSSQVRKQLEAQLDNWLKYAAIRFEVSDSLLSYLQAYLNPEDLREILKHMLWQGALHGDPTLNKIWAQPQLPTSLRQSKTFFEALRRGQLASMPIKDEAERGQYLRFVRDYTKQLELASFVIMKRQLPTLVRIEQKLRQNQDAQWKIIRNETLDQITHLTHGLRTQEATAQGHRDQQQIPQALGASVLPPQKPDLWPFSLDVLDKSSIQILEIGFRSDEAGKDQWQLLQPESGRL